MDTRPRKVTDRQILDALKANNGHRANSARDLGITERALYNRLPALKGEGLIESVCEPLAEGQRIGRITTTIRPDGSIGNQWIKTREDDQQVFDAIKNAFKSVKPIPIIKQAQKRHAKNLLAVYPLGDPHIGMYSWADETGDDFDLDIAEKNLIGAMQRLIDSVPSCDQALIVNLDDFFHADTTAGVTLRSGNVLDTDTQWAKVLRIGVRAMRTCIESALMRHKTVRVINEIGNHDEHTSTILTLALSMLYEKNRRVSFDDSPATFHYYPFGDVLIGVTHGDRVKLDKLGPIMATDRPEEWGKAKHRYWLTGHVHNQRVFEFPGVLVESFRTLAAKDAWHSASGYRSGRDAQAIVMHSEHGEIERHRIDIRQIVTCAH